ncbi:hypothetical protein SCHPADRAFT_925547 [Schizopora paradoxa]|uniref:Uncharacterized protein n=1 Tax=Schizopora paradoxa TaxID=27342 RepID=A0A0H2S0H0_9AGAM|nr:hypothetical protein SCHPADRAFT_925547 [Schizopora paradoxa]
MVANSNIPQLEANECFDEVWKAKVRFNNPSQALLAQLFLKDDGAIPLPAFDALLSVIRNPSFNVKDIKFKDCGEFCSFVASSRVEIVTRRGWGSETGIPEVVLEGALGILSDGLRGVYEDVKEHYHGQMPTSSERSEYGSSFEDALTAWREALSTCALVHSSWHVRARPLLGFYHSCHASGRLPLSRSLTNPSLGPWTRDLQIRFEERSPIPHDATVSAFFTRLPNLRTFHLDTFPNKSRPYDIFIAELCKLLSSLTSLEELYFTTLAEEKHKRSNDLVQHLSKAAPPKLRLVRFTSGSFDSARPSLVPQWLSPLLSVPSLEYISIQDFDVSPLIGASWSRSKSSTDSNTFDLVELSARLGAPGRVLKDSVLDAFKAAKRLNLEYAGGGEATVGDILSSCPSLLSLSLCGDRRDPKFFDIAKVLPHSVEELNITFSPSGIPDDDNSEENALAIIHQLDAFDTRVFQALHPGSSPRLRVVKIYIHPIPVMNHEDIFYSPNHRQLYRKKVVESGTEESLNEVGTEPVLPLCQRICHERAVSFSVQIRLLRDDFED